MPGWGKNPNVESMKTKPIARPPHKLGPNQKETAMKRQRRDPNFKQSRDICEDRGEHLHGIEDIEREEARSENDDKRVTRANGLRIFPRELGQVRIGAAPAHEARPGRFAKSEPETDARHSGDECFVDILHRFDEVRLAENEIEIGGLFDGDGQ